MDADIATKTAALVTRVKRSEIKDLNEAVVAMTRLMYVQYVGLLGGEILQPSEERQELILVQKLIDIECANGFLYCAQRIAAIEQFSAELNVMVTSEVCGIDEAPKRQRSKTPVSPVHWSESVQENALQILLRLGWGQPCELVGQAFNLTPQETKELDVATKLSSLKRAKLAQLLKAAGISEEDAASWHLDLVYLANLQAFVEKHGAADERTKSTIASINRFTPCDAGYDEKQRLATELIQLMAQAEEAFIKGYPVQSAIAEIEQAILACAKRKKVEGVTAGGGEVEYGGELMKLKLDGQRLEVSIANDLIVSNHVVGSFDIVAVLNLEQDEPRFLWQSEDFDNVDCKVLARELLNRFVRAVDRKRRGEPQVAEDDED